METRGNRTSLAEDLSVISSGIVNISSGVTSTGLEVTQTGIVRVLNGGWAETISAADGGTVVVSKGGILYLCTLTGGTATVLNGGWAETVSVEEGGLYLLSSGASTHDTRISGGGSVRIGRDVMATGITVLDGGVLHVDQAGYARAPIVSSGGAVYVSATGIVDKAQIYGSVFVSSGGSFNSSIVNSSAEATIAAGGICSKVQVRGGTLSMESGALVRGTAVDSGGRFILLGTEETGNASASDSDSSGGANDTTVNAGGTMTVASGGTAKHTTVNSGGTLLVSSGGTAAEITENGGYVEVADGADVSFSSNTISSLEFSAAATVHSGTTFVDVTVISGGTMHVYDGGMLAGTMTFEATASVFIEEGGVVAFDLNHTETGDDALVNDLSIIQGTPIYTLTVDGTEEKGAYALADGAAEFTGSISVVNKTGDELSTLAVGETVRVADVGYTLILTDSLLSVTVKWPVLPPPEDLVGTTEGVSWKANGADGYVVEYSTDGFKHVVSVVTTGNAVDTPDLPAGTYQWRVRVDVENSEWAVGDAIVSEVEPNAPEIVRSNEDGNDDLFFATPNGTWGNIFYAQHVGSIHDGWGGTNETVSANGKGRIQNLFLGSADPNVLCLSDGDNGDAIFMDDVFTELPESIAEQTARLFKIHEIRAGAGDDIVDMTSQRFEYTGDGRTIRGGDGDDIIGANTGDNLLFGDAGNDRIVGASGNDVIAGGIGNDRMHGGGGDDVFTFCDNWGVDEVEQLAGGKVTLWFASGDESKWNPDTLTYSDGDNSVTVKGSTSVELKFGNDCSTQYGMFSFIGAFTEFSTQKIFEESDGLLAFFYPCCF